MSFKRVDFNGCAIRLNRYLTGNNTRQGKPNYLLRDSALIINAWDMAKRSQCIQSFAEVLNLSWSRVMVTLYLFGDGTFFLWSQVMVTLHLSR